MCKGIKSTWERQYKTQQRWTEKHEGQNSQASSTLLLSPWQLLCSTVGCRKMWDMVRACMHVMCVCVSNHGREGSGYIIIQGAKTVCLFLLASINWHYNTFPFSNNIQTQSVTTKESEGARMDEGLVKEGWGQKRWKECGDRRMGDIL